MNHNDKNLVQGRGQFKVFEEISSLQFAFILVRPVYVNRVLQSFRSDKDFMIT